MKVLIQILKNLESEYINSGIGIQYCTLYTICTKHIAIHTNFFNPNRNFDCSNWGEKTCCHFLERLIKDMDTHKLYGNFYIHFNNGNGNSLYYMIDVSVLMSRTVGPYSKEDFIKIVNP